MKQDRVSTRQLQVNIVKGKRPIRIEGDTAFITLTKGYEAIIDAADVPLVEGRNWKALIGSNTIYATDSSTRLLHRVLLNPEPEVTVDHRDRDGLNCRRGNLRIATRSQNQCNRITPKATRSGAKGVDFHRQSGLWRARIKLQGRCVFCKYFKTMEEARQARAVALELHHGEFARHE